MFRNLADCQLHGIYSLNRPQLQQIFAPNYDSISKYRTGKFKERLKNYISKTQNSHCTKKQETNKNSKLCDVMAELRQCYDMIDQINTQSVSSLSENERMSDTEWSEKLIMLRGKQKRIQELTRKCTNVDVQIIEMKLKRRREKRKRIRQRKQETSRLQALRTATIGKKYRAVDEWFQETTRTIEGNRKRVQEDERIEQILIDVKRKKSEAVKTINLIESLIDLHRVRWIQGSSTDCSECAIAYELSNLRTRWLSKYATYTEKEQKLRESLKLNAPHVEWRKILFGVGQYIKSKEINLIQNKDELIRLRNGWDAFVTTSSSGSDSSIPIGWITPNATPSIKWKAYSNE